MDLNRNVRTKSQDYKAEQPKPKAIRKRKNKLTFYPTQKRLPTGFAEQRIDQNSIILFG